MLKNLNFFVGASRILFRLDSEIDSKNENKIRYLKAELIDAISPKFFNHKEKTCARSSCKNTLIFTNSRRKFCSVEYRKKGLEISEEMVYYTPLQSKFNHDYSFGFSSKFLYCICSQKIGLELSLMRNCIELS